MKAFGVYLNRSAIALNHCNLESDAKFDFDLVEVIGSIEANSEYDVTLFKVASMISFLESLTQQKVSVVGMGQNKRFIREEDTRYRCCVSLRRHRLWDFFEYLWLCVLPNFVSKFGFFTFKENFSNYVTFTLKDSALFFGLGKELLGVVEVTLFWQSLLKFSQIEDLFGFGIKPRI